MESLGSEADHIYFQGPSGDTHTEVERRRGGIGAELLASRERRSVDFP